MLTIDVRVTTQNKIIFPEPIAELPELEKSEKV